MPASVLQSRCLYGVGSEAPLVLIFETIWLVIYSANWQWTGVLVGRDKHCSRVFMPFKAQWRVCAGVWGSFADEKSSALNSRRRAPAHVSVVSIAV